MNSKEKNKYIEKLEDQVKKFSSRVVRFLETPGKLEDRTNDLGVLGQYCSMLYYFYENRKYERTRNGISISTGTFEDLEFELGDKNND